MGDLLFRIKRDDAERAVEALWLDETVPPERILTALKALRGNLDIYISQLEEEGSANGTPQAT